MKQCPTCEKPITGHPNKKYCNNKCRYRYHNTQPARIERSKKWARPITKTVVVSQCSISKLLDDKINHPFKDMTKYGDQ